MAPTINAGATAAPIRKPGNGTGEIHSIVSTATSQSVARTVHEIDLGESQIIGKRAGAD